MNPDTQTFSDIMAIDTSDKICLQIHLKAAGKYRLIVNDRVISAQHSETYWDLLTPLHIKIKNLSLSETVAVEKISVNDIQILPRFRHLSSNQTDHINHPGIWSFIISEPFYIWYHQVAGYGMVA